MFARSLALSSFTKVAQMSGRGVYGLLISAVVVLAIVYVYNRFSGKSIADLGRPVSAK